MGLRDTTYQTVSRARPEHTVYVSKELALGVEAIVWIRTNTLWYPCGPLAAILCLEP